MDPVTIAMLAGTAIKGISSLVAGGKARKMRKEGESYLSQAAQKDAMLGPSPTMEVPQSVDDYINLSRKMARQEMPGATQMRQDIAQTNAGMLSGAMQAGQGADTMAAVLAAGQNRMRALSQMGIAASQYRSGQQQNYAQAVASRAPWEQQQFEYNEWIPWQQQKNEAVDMRNMGLQMKYQGMDMGAAAGIQGANMLSQDIWGMTQNPATANWLRGLGGGAQGMASPNPVQQGMTDPMRPAYSPPGGTYDQLPFGQ